MLNRNYNDVDYCKYGFLIEKEPGFGITFQIGNRGHYAKKIAGQWMVIDTPSLRKGDLLELGTAGLVEIKSKLNYIGFPRTYR